MAYKRKDTTFMAELCRIADSYKPRIAYRLLRDYNGKPKTLYHAHGESMILPLDQWLRSQPKIVYNPGKRTTGAKGFRAGFHVFPNLVELVKYCKGMDPAYAVVEVLVSGKIRRKPRSRSTVLLAERMQLTSGCWECRLPLSAFLGGE